MPLGFLQAGDFSAVRDAARRDLFTSPSIASQIPAFVQLVVERKADALYGLTVLIYITLMYLFCA